MRTFLLTALVLSSASAMSSSRREAIMGYTVDNKGIVFQVHTGGCTKKGSFELKVKKNKKVSRVTLHRISGMMCQMFVPWGTTVSYSWDEIGLEPGSSFRIANPRKHLVAGPAFNTLPEFD